MKKSRNEIKTARNASKNKQQIIIIVIIIINKINNACDDLTMNNGLLKNYSISNESKMDGKMKRMVGKQKILPQDIPSFEDKR